MCECIMQLLDGLSNTGSKGKDPVIKSFVFVAPNGEDLSVNGQSTVMPNSYLCWSLDIPRIF